MRTPYLVFVMMAVGCASKAPPPPASPLDEGNHAFHTEYDRLRLQEESQLGTSRPLITVEGPNATLKYAGQETQWPITGERYTSLKTVTHLAMAAPAFLLSLPAGPLSASDAAHLAKVKATALSVEQALSPEQVGAEMVPAQKRLLKAIVDLLATAATRGRPSEDEVRAYGRAIRADVLANLSAASAAQLEALHAAVTAMRARVGSEAWSRAVAFVNTAHQARGREVSVQYFERLFGERMTEGAIGEQRLVVTESKRGAATMMATHLLDRRLGDLLFDDPAFLQGDVLGSSGKKHVERLLPSADQRLQGSSESR